MSITLLEIVVAIILLIVAWQIGILLAPNIIRVLRGLKHEVDEAADSAMSETEPEELKPQQRKEHTNGTHR